MKLQQNRYDYFPHNYVTMSDVEVTESHPLATKTNGKICTIPLPAFISLERCTLHVREARKRNKNIIPTGNPIENVVPNFRSPYPVDSIPPHVSSRRATTLGDSAT